MKPDQLHDAMTLLPDELLEPIDALRRKKRFPWKSVLATAACFCLVVGLALGYARIIAPASSAENGAANDAAEAPMQEAVSQSKTEEPSLVKVVEVTADHIIVVDANPKETDSCVQRAPITLTFEKLSQIPTLETGQKILIYWDTEDYDPAERTITPYKIEIAEE